MSTSLAQCREHNLRVFLGRGGSHLRAGYQVFVIARDVKRGKILLGGLGGCGVGEMWFSEEPLHAGYPGYVESQELDSTGGFGA